MRISCQATQEPSQTATVVIPPARLTCEGGFPSWHEGKSSDGAVAPVALPPRHRGGQDPAQQRYPEGAGGVQSSKKDVRVRHGHPEGR